MTEQETAAPLTRCADLWLLEERAVDRGAADFRVMEIMSSEERRRYARLRGERPKRLHLGARMLVRYVLAAYTGVRPQDLQFEVGLAGRPRLVPNPTGLQFNISHTTGLIGCVLTQDRGCGLDVEGVPLAPEVAQAMLRFLAQEERDAVGRRGRPDQGRAVLEHWVVKEAYLKALGVGLTRGLDSFTVRDLDGPRIRIDDRAVDTIDAQVELQERVGRHVIAVVLARKPGEVTRVPVRVLDFASFLQAAAGQPSPAAGASPQRSHLAA
jgi:4'-phosphopantetheinyl transferase